MSSPSFDPLRIVFSGMVASVPGLGGATWATLQWLLGLQGLGHDVYLVDQVGADQLRPAGTTLADSQNAAYCRQVMVRFGLEDRASLVLAGSRETVGVELDRLLDIVRSADLLINVAGALRHDLVTEIPVRAYLDLDPGFVQLWHEIEGIDMGLEGHTHFVTVGLLVGARDCGVPVLGRAWITTPPPVVLKHWPVPDGPTEDALTTVANWRSYGSIEHGGVLYGQKAHALRTLIELPRATPTRFRLALRIHPDEVRDLGALRANGWELVDPAQAAGTPDLYWRFVRSSMGEFGIAKSGYVASHSGWFSDRSACYLASGRPVLAHDTGFGRVLPTGEGLFAFTTAADVLAGIDRIHSDYQGQRFAAREIAEAHLESGRVIGRLLEELGGTRVSRPSVTP